MPIAAGATPSTCRLAWLTESVIWSLTAGMPWLSLACRRITRRGSLVATPVVAVSIEYSGHAHGGGRLRRHIGLLLRIGGVVGGVGQRRAVAWYRLPMATAGASPSTLVLACDRIGDLVVYSGRECHVDLLEVGGSAMERQIRSPGRGRGC